MNLSLRTKILLLTAGSVTGLAALVALALALLTGQELNRIVADDVRTTGGVLAQLMRERSRSLKEQSRLLVRDPAHKAGIQQGDAPTCRDFAEDFRQQLSADSALLTDRDGRALGETDSAASYHADRAQEPGVSAALDGQEWTGVVRRGAQMMLAVSVPVRVGTQVVGTFTAYSAINSQIARDLRNAVPGRDVAFVDGGRVVGASLLLPGHIPTPRLTPSIVTLGSTRYYALYAPLPDTEAQANLGFVVLRSQSQASAMIGRIQQAFGVTCLLMLPLALGAGGLVARGITRPLDGVVRAAKTLQGGGWPERFECARKDEVGLLQTVFNEMTASLRASQERLLALIDTDPLTGLYNHRRFQERLAQETARCGASGESLALLLFDIDVFQAYNQRKGHAEGDAVLEQLGLLLQTELPAVGIAARYGGDQFAILLPCHDLDQAETLAERLRGQALGCWREREAESALTLSVGCAEVGVRTADADSLALAAELALSQAKQLGRDRVCRFDSVSGAEEQADPYELQRFFKDHSLAAIQALAAAVDAKDPYTQGHSQRVAAYASSLAKWIGLSPAEVELIFTTGTLHDVGKIGVPDAILKKPSRLDDDERAMMETHPAMGEVIVRKVPQLAATLPGVRHHHERWDGKGYPDHLAGEAIPYMARILAIADTFDAMTSDRPYRKGLDWEIALNEVAKNAGTQFDPELAPPFIAMMQARLALPRAA